MATKSVCIVHESQDFCKEFVEKLQKVNIRGYYFTPEYIPVLRDAIHRDKILRNKLGVIIIPEKYRVLDDVEIVDTIEKYEIGVKIMLLGDCKGGNLDDYEICPKDISVDNLVQKIVQKYHDTIRIITVENYCFVNEIRTMLTPNENRIMRYLIENHGIVVSSSDLEIYALGFPRAYVSNIVNVTINSIRNKLDKCIQGSSKMIETVRGYGWRYIGA
jgi:hypothetical protein